MSVVTVSTVSDKVLVVTATRCTALVTRGDTWARFWADFTKVGTIGILQILAVARKEAEWIGCSQDVLGLMNSVLEQSQGKTLNI